MATVRLTKKAVDSAGPNGTGDAFLWDKDLRGFGLRITKAGVKSYVLQYRMRGQPARRLTIGIHGSPWTIELARREAEQKLIMVRQGRDPVDVAKQQAVEARANRQRKQELAFPEYADQFVKLYLMENWPDTWKTGKGTLKPLKTHLKDRALDEITRSDVARILETYADRPGARKLAHAVLRKLFNWAVDRGDLDHSPIAGMKAPRPVPARRRVLSPTELVCLWRASQKVGDPWGPFVRLLILTLQRRDEVASMDWSEIDLDGKTWTLPGERAKNNHPHRIPLSPLALIELKALGPHSTGLVFTTTGTTPVSGFSKAKRVLDVHMQEAWNDGGRNLELSEAGDSIAPWRFHDLRRTGATNLQALGVPVEVTEAVLNHISGTVGGIAGVYNLYRYEPEKRKALDAWSRRIAAQVRLCTATR